MTKSASTPWWLSLFALAACASPDPIISGGFEERVLDQDFLHGQELEAVDLDGDGDLDLVVALSLTDAVHVYLNPGNLDEDWARISISGPGAVVAVGIGVADLDGDGDLDVAATSLFDRRIGANSAGALYWYENPGDVRGVWSTHPISDYVLGPGPLTVGDVDGDERPDLLVGGIPVVLPNETLPQSDGLSWWQNQGGRFYGPLLIDNTIQEVAQIALADLDGDQRPDIVATARTSRELSIYRRTETSTPTYTKYRVASGLGAFSGLAVSPEAPLTLITAIAHTASTTVQRFSATELAGPWAQTVLAGPIGQGGGDLPHLALATFSGGEPIDLAVTTSAGDLRLFPRDPNDRSRTTQVDIRGGYRGLNGVVAADLDNDGRIDLVTTTFEFGTRDRLTFWRNVR